MSSRKSGASDRVVVGASFAGLACALAPMRWAAGRIYFHQRAVVIESPAEDRRFEPQ